MNQATGNFLILFPKNPFWAPKDMYSIAQALCATGLAGKERESFLFNTGSQYLALVTYLGCSPQITLGENDEATTIHISGIFDTPQFVRGENLKHPRCPQCRKNLEKQEFPNHFDVGLNCSHCGHAGSMHEFDWRHSAAFGRVFIEISNVYESEAVPGEELTDCLLQATGEIWDYCYVRRSGS